MLLPSSGISTMFNSYERYDGKIIDTCFTDVAANPFFRNVFSEQGIIQAYQARHLNAARNVATWYHQRRDFTLHHDYAFYTSLTKGASFPLGMQISDVQKFLHLHPLIKKYLSKIESDV